MNTFKGYQKTLALAGVEFEAYEAYDNMLKQDCLVISYWDSHTRIEMVYDMEGNFLYADEENDLDYL